MENNLKNLTPWVEQLRGPGVASGAGSCMTKDDRGNIYELISATSFWVYSPQQDAALQLASPPAGTVGVGTAMTFVKAVGKQVNGEVFGSIYAWIAAAGTAVFYRYDIGDNTWSSALSVSGPPAAFGTDGSLEYPGAMKAGNVGGYHDSLALCTVTAAGAPVGATAVPVAALGLALPSGAVLNFGTLSSPIYAVLTAAAAAAATSITVSALVKEIPKDAKAYFYANMFLIGHASTTWYRYNIAGNAWTTTSSNTATPALPVLPAAPGAGNYLRYLPGSGRANALNELVYIRGGGQNAMYVYDLVANTWSAALTYYPSTETVSSASGFAARLNDKGLASKPVMKLGVTNRIGELDMVTGRVRPLAMNQNFQEGAAVVGDRATIIRDPDGLEYMYIHLSSVAYFIRIPIMDN